MKIEDIYSHYEEENLEQNNILVEYCKMCKSVSTVDDTYDLSKTNKTIHVT